MPGVVGLATVPPTLVLVLVRIVDEAPPRPRPEPRSRTDWSSRVTAPVELVLGNGRVLRVSETISPEVLSRLAAALDG